MRLRCGGGNWIMLDAEEEIRGNQHGLNGELDALFCRLVISPGEVDKFNKSRDFVFGYGAAVRATRQSGDDSLDTGRAGVRIADKNLLAAGLLYVGGERADELD